MSQHHTAHREQIEQAFDRVHTHDQPLSERMQDSVQWAMAQLDTGQLRVAEPLGDGSWQVNAWVKKAVLLSFAVYKPQHLHAGPLSFYDKLPLKHAAHDAQAFARDKVRVVPPGTVRYGAYLGPRTVIMPSYVNVGAYVGEGTLVDTWATVGSCAQIGRGVHLSGGAGIGGVLEPVQALPTIVEDDCFIGARSEIVEGVIVGRGAVISMGVYIGQSTKIFDRATGTVSYGRIPPYAVVVPGALPSADGTHSVYAAIIIKQVDETTRSKLGINALLRDHAL